MNGYRKYMMNNNENLGWCKPIDFGMVQISVNDGKINSIRIDGEDLAIEKNNSSSGSLFSEKTLDKIARIVNDDYKVYRGYDATHIILDANGEEMPCRSCPWFDVCDAMDNPDGWENDEYPDD